MRTAAPSAPTVAPHDRAPLGNVQRVGADQLHVAVDPGAFVEPAFAEARVGADGDDIRAAVVIEEVADVDAERRVAALVAADDIAVHEDQAVAEDSVELEPDLLAR